MQRWDRQTDRRTPDGFVDLVSRTLGQCQQCKSFSLQEILVSERKVRILSTRIRMEGFTRKTKIFTFCSSSVTSMYSILSQNTAFFPNEYCFYTCDSICMLAWMPSCGPGSACTCLSQFGLLSKGINGFWHGFLLTYPTRRWKFRYLQK